MNKKTLPQLNMKNCVTHAIQLKLRKQMNKEKELVFHLYPKHQGEKSKIPNRNIVFLKKADALFSLSVWVGGGDR